MDVIVVVDMQVGLLDGAPKYDLQGVVRRINSLMEFVRRRSGKVIWIRHCGGAGDAFEPHKEGWEFLPELNRNSEDLVIEKTLNDPFAGTLLKETLDRLAPDRVIVAGWATDFCVDAAVRSAVSNDFHVVVVSDGHTLSDRPDLDASIAIRYHNWKWADLITNRTIRVISAEQLMRQGA